jgi:hypothetical protein
MNWPIIRNVFTLFVSVLLFSFFISIGWVEIIDDAYIYFRYAYNLAHGYGYVYNLGQNVEAVTSITWTFLLTITTFFSVPPEISSRIFGYLCGVAIIILLWNELREKNISPIIIFFVLILFITNRNYYASIMLGLETGLYSLLLLLFYLSAKRSAKSIKHQFIFSAIGLLLFLTRPESAVIFLMIFLGLIIINFDDSEPPTVALTVLIVGVMLISFLRYSVFGVYLPNSVLSKSLLIESISNLNILLPRILYGSYYIALWLLSSLFLTIPAFLNIRDFLIEKSFSIFVAGSMILTGIFVALLNSGDWMPFSRLLTPYLPIITILSAISIDRFVRENKWFSKIKINIIATSVALLIGAYSLWMLLPITYFKYEPWAEGKCYEDAGSLLKPYLNKTSLIAPEAIGAIGFKLMEIPILDFFGLTEPYIAKKGTIPRAAYSMGKHNYEYTMARQPDLFFFHSNLGNHIPYLNKWEYSTKYTTYNLINENGQLTIGIKNSLDSLLVPPLQKGFDVQQIDTKNIIRNPAADWPLGEK